jgi:hypothetical protein
MPQPRTASLESRLREPAHADGNSANLDQLVGQAYTQFQHGCTPSEPAQFQRVAWDAPPGGQGGSGRIIDANPNTPDSQDGVGPLSGPKP